MTTFDDRIANMKARKIKQMILDNGPRFFRVEFIKKDGTLRTINGHVRMVAGHTQDNPTAHIEKYITVVLAQKDANGREQWRNVNCETIQALHIGGKRIVIE